MDLPVRSLTLSEAELQVVRLGESDLIRRSCIARRAVRAGTAGRHLKRIETPALIVVSPRSRSCRARIPPENVIPSAA